MSVPVSYELVVRGIGHALPEYVVDNHYFERFMDTSDEWIRTRTGIRTRHWALPANGETANDLAAAAALKACRMAGVSPADDIDFIICGTLTPNEYMPTMACRLQHMLGSTRGFAFDLSAACAGFVFGLSVAEGYLRSGKYRRGLVVGTEVLSAITNFYDRGTCVLFGDGAGAFVVEAMDPASIPPDTFFRNEIFSDGSYHELLTYSVGSRVTARDPRWGHDNTVVHMKGNELFKVAVRFMQKSVEACLKDCPVGVSDIDLFVPHQANIRIIDKLAEVLDLPREKVYTNIDRVGNTSVASIPIACGMAHEEGRLVSGNKVLATTFGGGLNFGACLFSLMIPGRQS